MENLRKEGVEHGSHLWNLEEDEQGTEASQAKIHSNALQSAIQGFGEKKIVFSVLFFILILWTTTYLLPRTDMLLVRSAHLDE